jgi:DNA-binding transcriptional ArsR family regulator
MSKSEKLKSVVYPQLAQISQALAHPSRIHLIELLAQSERTVEWLAAMIDQTVGTTSHHLKILRVAHLVTTRRSGTYVHYRATDAASALWSGLCAAGAQADAEISTALREFVQNPKSFAPASAREVQRKVASGEIVLLDVRPEDEFAAGHFPGAISAPSERVGKMLEGLPREATVVAYCRGPFCLLSDDVVSLLRSRGIHAVRWAESPADWRGRGVALAVGASAITSRTGRVRR